MASLLGHLHFWSLKRFVVSVGSDIGTHVYHEKASGTGAGGEETIYSDQRRLWGENRGVSWTPKNRRPERLRDLLRECEELLLQFKVVSIRWRTLRNVQLLLSNGTLISILVSFYSGDIEKISIDKSLAGKVSDPIHQAIIAENFLLLSFLERTKLCYIYLNKKPSLDFKKLEKLSGLEPKTSYIDFPGPSTKKFSRHLSLNSRHDMVVVWWSGHSEEAWPWSPMTGDKDRSNLVIFGLNGSKIEMLCYVRTECDPIHAAFSYSQPHHVHTLEQSSTGGGDSSVDSCIYEYTGNKIERVAVTTIPVKASIIVQQRNHAEDKLLLGCEDGTLMLYDDHRRVTQMTQATLVPYIIQWHPADAVVLVCSARGDLQIFDMALAPVLIQLVAEQPAPRQTLELLQFFPSPVKLSAVSWSCEAPIGNIADNSIGCHDNLLLLFDRGPLCLLRVELGVLTHGRLGSVEIVSEYIRHDQAEEAVNFLNSMNWNTEGSACFACMNLIMNYLLKLPLNSEREGLLEESLGSFYAPSRPLSDVTVLQFRDMISRLSRRFFHHLLRYKRFEKAFLLAVDIGAKDLFMDIHYLACDVGNFALAEVAKQRALQIDNEPLTSDTDESYDDEEDDLSCVDEELSIGERNGEEGAHFQEDGYESIHNHPLSPQHLMPLEEEDDDGAILMLQGAQTSHYSGHEIDQEPDLPGEMQSSGGTLKIVHFGVV